MNDYYGVYNRPDDYTGYDVSNCADQSKAADCSRSCAAGYFEDSLNPIQILTDDSTGKFIFKGCYPTEALTLNEKVERLLSDRNILHVSANDYALNSIVGSINSNINKYGETYNIFTYTNHPGVTTVKADTDIPVVGDEDAKYFDFNKSTRYLANLDFNRLNLKENSQQSQFQMLSL